VSHHRIWLRTSGKMMNGFEQVLSSHIVLHLVYAYDSLLRYSQTLATCSEDPRLTMASFSRSHPNKARPTKNPQFLKARSAMLPLWMLKRMNVVSF